MNWFKNKDNQGKLTVTLTIAIAMTMAVLLPLFSTVPQSSPQAPNILPGQSVTLLPDGRWLLIGGESVGGSLDTAAIWNPVTGSTTQLTARLQHARAWHSATMLPEGTILVLGGIDSSGQVLSHPEVFNPETSSFADLPPAVAFSPRARHTASLLTDGHVVVAGGVDAAGQTLATAELWNALDALSATQVAPLTSARRDHKAVLTEEGQVLLRAGVDANGDALSEGDLFDPATLGFTRIDAATLASLEPSGNPMLVASIPVNNSVDVPVDSMISLRFSKPLKVETINRDTVTLNGPSGIKAINVVPAEGGMLAFVEPAEDLLPGATYSLSVNGAIDRDGLLLPVSGISFSTAALPGTSGTATPPPPGDGGTQSSGTSETTTSTSTTSAQSTADDDFVWRGELKDGKPHSPWQDLPPLQAPPGVTALSGQVLNLGGLPLANVALELEDAAKQKKSGQIETDETGRFLLTDLEPGWQELIIDGVKARVNRGADTVANGPVENHGVFEYGLDIKPGETTVLPFTIWLPKIDIANAVPLPSPITSEFVVTSPRIPGLELRLAANSQIIKRNGDTATEVSLTQIPLDRTPFPLPVYVNPPVYFTAQPGGAYIEGYGARVIYPNTFKELPGARANFWHYTTEGNGWTVYGMGTVTQDGTRVVPDRGVRIYEFLGAMINFRSPGPPTGCKAGPDCGGGDPVDLPTGLFTHAKTDLSVPDVMPITLTRTYVATDVNSRPFGVGASHPYEIFLWSANQYEEADLILPDQSRIHYERTSPPGFPSFSTAVFEHRPPDSVCPKCVGSPTKYFGSKIVYGTGATGLGGWIMTLKDGSELFFRDTGPLQYIRDRNGNQTTIVRTPDEFGNIASILSPNNRWIEFSYDASNRITQARDNIGRTVNYEYDASGRLIKVTDPNGGVTEYSYDGSGRMLTLKDPRQIVYLTNEYDANGRVIKQTRADGTTFQFAYTLDGGGKVTQVDLTDPRGKVRRTVFDANGYPTTNTYALGTPEEQVITNEWETGSNLRLSVTDALVINSQNRKTAYTYDSKGNVLTVTRMAQDPASAVTTTYTYEPTFNQVATITDPLGAGHTTTFSYDAKGNLTTITDPLNHTTTMTYNAQAQLTSTKDALNNTTQFNYENGDLVSVTDPLGNATSRLLDGVGRLLALTNPLGNLTQYSYDSLSRLTQVVDSLNGSTAFGYDPNSNLLSVTDAKTPSGVTAYTYNNMDRLQTRTDPLNKAESYVYDNSGNLVRSRDRKLQETIYTYDALNRRTQTTYQDNSTTTYTYDKANRITQINDSISGLITRTYDGLDRLTSETTLQGSVTYTYDNASRRATMTVSGQSQISYTYDNANRLTQITQGSSIVTFGYDNANRRTSLTLPNGIVVEYAYDAASRVTEITYKQGGTTVIGNLTYEYDKAGNRTKTGGTWARTGVPQNVTATTYDANNRQLTFGDKTLAYDDNGNLQTITDANGTTIYSWNARNQLVGISGPSVNASFVYDGQGRRQKKTISGNTTEFLYDGVNPVQETSGTTVLANMLPGLGIDEFFTRIDVGAGITSNFLTDALGSAIALADSSGAVQSENTYEPFGKTTATGVSSTNPFQFTGRENDGTRLYYYRARYYHPEIQRFTAEDPLRFDGGDYNLYAYVSNNPIKSVDPTGEAQESPPKVLSLVRVTYSTDQVRAQGNEWWCMHYVLFETKSNCYIKATCHSTTIGRSVSYGAFIANKKAMENACKGAGENCPPSDKFSCSQITGVFYNPSNATARVNINCDPL